MKQKNAKQIIIQIDSNEFIKKFQGEHLNLC